MAVSAFLYRSVLNQAFGSLVGAQAPNIDWLSDALKVMLSTSVYAPDASAHKFKSDITNEVVGTGYVAGGTALTSPTITYTTANSWGTTWTALTAYAVGDVIRPTAGNAHLYRCVVAGTSGAVQPTFTLVSGATTIDATVTWAEIGGGINQFGGANVLWPASTITARFAVIYDGTPGTDATRPLIGYVDFGADQSSSNGTFQITWSGLGIFVISTP